MKYEIFYDGLVILGDTTDQQVFSFIEDFLCEDRISIIHTDPPYGNILNIKWDKTKNSQSLFVYWMLEWFNQYLRLLEDGGAFYIWGGIGKKRFRPFFQFLSLIENDNVKLSNLITWKKKRGYGVSNNYLFTREELAFIIKGDKPKTFNVPYLDEVRGYAGYNKKYPAKSEFFRRTNVWTDITEILKGKSHVAQKPLKVCEIPIAVSSNKKEWVLDLFAGSGQTAIAARKLGRRFILVEKDENYFNKIIEKLR